MIQWRETSFVLHPSVGSPSFVFPLYGTFNSLQSTPTYMHPWSTSLPLPNETDGFTPATFTPCTLFGLLAFRSNLLFLFLPREDHKHNPLDPSYFATGFSRHHAKWRFAHVNEFCTVIAPSVCVDHASLPPLCANVYLVTLSFLSSTNKSERQAGEQINEVFHPKSALDWADKQRLNCHSTSKLLFLYSPSPFLYWSCWFLEDSATGMSSGYFLWYDWEGGDYVARTGSLVAVSLYQTWTHTPWGCAQITSATRDPDHFQSHVQEEEMQSGRFFLKWCEFKEDQVAG